MDVPVEILDREVARAAAALARARARLVGGVRFDEPNPLVAHRRVSSRATYLKLAEPRVASPLTPGLRAWVRTLTLERVLWPDVVRLVAAWNDESVALEHPGLPTAMFSPRALLRRMLAEPVGARRAVFADALARGAGATADAARILAERRVEATRLLGDPSDTEAPGDPIVGLGPAAERLLGETAQYFRGGADWSSVIASGVGREFGEGWPARLRSRWLEDTFRATGLTDGLQPTLGPLPEPIGAASFGRALSAFGGALVDATTSSRAFVLARAPYDLQRARRSALFGGLVADPVFAGRALGLGPDRARDQARGIGRALLVTARLDAARVLLRGSLVLQDSTKRMRFEEVTAAALGAPIPAMLAGVVPRLGPDDPTRFTGLLLSVLDRRRLVDRFDEDWFRNPRAALAIREEDCAEMESCATEAALTSGVAEISSILAAFG